MVAPRKSTRLAARSRHSAAFEDRKSEAEPTRKQVPPAQPMDIDVGADQPATPAAVPATSKVVPRLDRLPPELLTRILQFGKLRNRLKLRACNRAMEDLIARSDLHCDSISITARKKISWCAEAFEYPERVEIERSGGIELAAKFEAMRRRLFSQATVDVLEIHLDSESSDETTFNLLVSLLKGCKSTRIKFHFNSVDNCCKRMRALLKKYESEGIDIRIDMFSDILDAATLRSFSRPVMFFGRDYPHYDIELFYELARRGHSMINVFYLDDVDDIIKFMKIVSEATVPQKIVLRSSKRFIRKELGESFGLNWTVAAGDKVEQIGESDHPEVEVELTGRRYFDPQGGGFQLVYNESRLSFRPIRGEGVRITISNKREGFPRLPRWPHDAIIFSSSSSSDSSSDDEH